LFSGKEVLRTMNVIRSRQHNLSTEQVNKIALSTNNSLSCSWFSGMRTDREAQGKAEGPWERQGRSGEQRRLGGGRQGASTETGERTGSKQRPHKTRDFEKCASMLKTYLLAAYSKFKVSPKPDPLRNTEDVLRPALSCINPRINDLCKNHQPHPSH